MFVGIYFYAYSHSKLRTWVNRQKHPAWKSFSFLFGHVLVPVVLCLIFLYMRMKMLIHAEDYIRIEFILQRVRVTQKLRVITGNSQRPSLAMVNNLPTTIISWTTCSEALRNFFLVALSCSELWLTQPVKTQLKQQITLSKWQVPLRVCLKKR